MNFEQFFSRLKASVSAMSGKQLGTMGVAFLLVVGLTIGSSYYLNTPTYRVLFSDMDPESAAAVMTKLKTAKVQYVLDEGGRTIRVPDNRVDELRLQYASDGMPGAGTVGFELFDRTAFGVTDFLEHVNYRRALEGELARTISSIGEVAGARVHIAMPQPSLFTGRDQPTKASVILKLRNNRALSPSTVQAITGLVSASIESLKPESVVIIDNYGRPLSKPDTGEHDAGVPLERQQRIEHDLTTRVVALLEPIVGPGHVRVNVSARLNSGSQEKTEEVFGPTPVIHSEQLSSVTTGSTTPGSSSVVSGGPARGVAGTQSNLPVNPNDPPAVQQETLTIAGAQSSGQQSSTRNYDVNKTVTHSVTPNGDVQKLSVAVLIDDSREPQAAQEGQPASATVKPRTAEDLQKIQALVSAAVGLDAERGDQITVENMSFEETPIEETLPPPGAWEKYGPQVFEALRMFGVVAIGFFAIFGIVRPMMKAATASAPAVKGSAAPKALAAVAAGTAPRTVQDLEAEMDAQLMSGDAMKMPVLTRRMAAITAKEPENAARLLRTWLNEE